MAFDWDAELLGPVMEIFGEGRATDPSSWPTYYPASGPAFQLTGAVFDQAYTRVIDLGGGATESSQHPVLGVRNSLFAAHSNEPTVGSGVWVPSTGKTYRIVEPRPDGHGHTLLILMETALGNG